MNELLKERIEELNAEPIQFSLGYYLTEDGRILKPDGNFGRRSLAKSKKYEGLLRGPYVDYLGNYKLVVIENIKKEIERFKQLGITDFIKK